MSSQYDRAFTLTLGGQTITAMSGNPDAALRVEFKIVTLVVQTPNNIHIKIYNLSPANSQAYLALAKQGAQLVLQCGYVGGSIGPIFMGDCWYAFAGRDNPTDTVLHLFAKDGGQAYGYALVNKTLAAGSTPKDHFNAFAQAMSQYGVTPGYTPDLSSPTYPRGVSFFGMAKDHLRTLAASTGNVWSIQLGQLQMLPTSGSTDGGGAYVLNSGTGLIGMPTQTFDGVMARCLINPALNCLHGSNLVQIDQADIQSAVLSAALPAIPQNSAISQTIAADGIYIIVHMEITGDSRGEPWYMDLTCYPASGGPPVTASQDKLIGIN